MKKKCFAAFLWAVVLALALTGCSCKHEWKEADFTAPKTCTLCAETEGEPLSYSVSPEQVEQAFKDKDAQGQGAMLKTAETEGNDGELYPIVMEQAAAAAGAIDWDGFQFLRSLVPELSGDAASELEALLDANYENEVLSFLSGEWVRLDNTDLDGCVLDIKVSGSSRLAMITDVSNTINSIYGFAVGDIKWKDIAVIDKNTIQFEDMVKGTTVSYDTTIGILDFEKEQIVTHGAAVAYLASIGNDQLWVRKSFAEENSRKNVLTAEDFIVYDDLTGEETDTLESLGNRSFEFLFIYSNPTIGPEDGYELRTSREIGLGCSIQEVEEVYGMGGKTTYAGTNDPFYNAFKLGNSHYSYPELLKVLERKVSYRVTYSGTDRDGPAISFLFDENDTVVVILFFNSRLEKNIELWRYSDGSLKWEWADWEG